MVLLFYIIKLINKKKKITVLLQMNKVPRLLNVVATGFIGLLR